MVSNRAAFWNQRAKAQKTVVFSGDSLTGGWKDLAAAFPTLAVTNRGIGGDVSRGLLFRFQEDVLDLHPTAIVLCIGTNDLNCHADPAGIVANISAMVDLARAYDPLVPIVISQVPPRDSAKAPTKPGAHADLNRRIVALGAGKAHLMVVDAFTPLAGADGKPVAEYFGDDHLHLIATGYSKWAAALTPAFAQLNIH